METGNSGGFWRNFSLKVAQFSVGANTHRGTPAALLAPRRGWRRCGMKSIEALIEDGGEITVGAIGSVECAATAADGHNAQAMLVRRD